MNICQFQTGCEPPGEWPRQRGQHWQWLGHLLMELADCELWYCDMIVMYSIFIPILLWTNGKWKTYLWILDFIQNSHCIAYIYIGYEKVLNGQPHLSPHLLESINSEDKTVKMRSSASVECGGSAQCCSPLLQPSEWFKDDKLIGFGSQELCSLSSLNNDQR